MTCTIIETDQGNLVELEITGKLTEEAYETFVPLIEQKIREHGKIRMVVILTDFYGWDAAALWEDLKFDAKHYSDLERLAIVGDSKWEAGMAKFCKPFTRAKIKYFDLADFNEAREWIRG
ncbi:MAG: STAS/SEC14 domain-containing protein [Planctomyces sp.]|nr:STAS/SEC14 domain-containing protein [Planctomyces sp.]